MNEIANPALDFFQEQLRASRALSAALFESAGKFERLTNDTLRHSFEEECRYLESLYAARDPEGVSAAHQTHLPALQAQVMDYCGDLARIATATNAALSRLAQDYAGKAGNGAAQAAAFGWPQPTGLQSAPGAEAFDAWSAIMRRMTRLATEYMETASQTQPGMAPHANAASKQRRK